MIKRKAIFRQGRAKTHTITKSCLITEGLWTHGQFQAIGSLLTDFHFKNTSPGGLLMSVVRTAAMTSDDNPPSSTQQTHISASCPLSMPT